MKSKEFDSTTVARYMLAYANSVKSVLNVTKVQKLLFIIYGIYLAENKRSFIKEHPQAWPYGPVFPRTRKKVDYTKVYELSDPEFDDLKKDTEAIAIIHKVIDSLSDVSASQLVTWSHAADGPWAKTIGSDTNTWGKTILDEDISAYFQGVDL